MLTAYFDDSGTGERDRVAVAAGYIATTHMWKIFESRWKTLLSKYAIRVMHRADLESFHGEFKNFTPKKRTEFVKKAHAIIKRSTYCGFGLALIRADFEELIGKHEILKRLGVFAWCAQGCLAGVRLWADENNIGNQLIQYVFEAGTIGSAQFDQVMQIMYRDEEDRQGYRIGGWSFQNKDVLPLQAADTAAYEFFKFVHNEVIENNKRPIRLSARDLFREQEIKFFRKFGANTFTSFVSRWDGTI